MVDWCGLTAFGVLVILPLVGMILASIETYEDRRDNDDD